MFLHKKKTHLNSIKALLESSVDAAGDEGWDLSSRSDRTEERHENRVTKTRRHRLVRTESQIKQAVSWELWRYSAGVQRRIWYLIPWNKKTHNTKLGSHSAEPTSQLWPKSSSINSKKKMCFFIFILHHITWISSFL